MKHVLMVLIDNHTFYNVQDWCLEFDETNWVRWNYIHDPPNSALISGIECRFKTKSDKIEFILKYL